MRQRHQLASANGLRREVNARNAVRCEAFAHEMTYGAEPAVIYGEDDKGSHGNFLEASYRRICADEAWRKRQGKATRQARVCRDRAIAGGVSWSVPVARTHC